MIHAGLWFSYEFLSFSGERERDYFVEDKLSYEYLWYSKDCLSMLENLAGEEAGIITGEVGFDDG